MAIWRDLVGILGSSLRLGFTGVSIKSSGGKLQVRDSADSATVPVEMARIDLSAGANIVSIAAGVGSAAWTLTLPTTDGSPGQVLGTDGNGSADWITAGATADKVAADMTGLAFGSTATINLFTMPANSDNSLVRVVIRAPFNGAPSLSIGVAGDESRYVQSTQVLLSQPAGTEFWISPGVSISASPVDLIATYSAGGATQGSASIIVHHAVPT